MRKYILCLIFIAVFFLNLSAVNTLISLPEISTASSRGLAGAVSAKKAEVNAVFYNPACVYGIKNFQGVFTYHNNPINNSSSTLTTLTIPIPDYGTFALSYVYDRQARVTDAPYGATDLSRYNQIVSLAYGFSISENIKLGGALRYINSAIGANNTTNIAVDAGAVFGWESNLTGSIAILDMGGQAAYSGSGSLLGSEVLGSRFGVGLNYDSDWDPAHKMSFSADGFYNMFESKYTAAIGAAYSFQEMITLRIGNKLDANGSYLLSLGAGFNYDFYGVKTRFDYAHTGKLAGSGGEVDSNLISISMYF